ncbi:hypothetical protein ACFL3I_03780 [Pseudomonadota bacterium]
MKATAIDLRYSWFKLLNLITHCSRVSLCILSSFLFTFIWSDTALADKHFVDSANTVEATVTDELAVNATPSLDLMITSSVDPVEDGESLTFTMTVSNPGATPLTNVVLEAVTPSHMSVYVSQQTTPRGECLSGYYCYAGGFIRWALGTLSPGEVRVVRFSSDISTDATDGEPITADAAVMVDNIVVAQDSHTVLVSEEIPRLQLALSANHNPVTPDGLVTYQLKYSNRSVSPFELAADSLTATVPAGMTFVSANGGGSESGGVVTWPISVGAGIDGIRDFTVRVDAGLTDGTLLRTEAHFADSLDAISAMATDVLVVDATPPLDLVITSSEDPVEDGGALTFTMTVSNPGSTPLTNVVLEAVTPSHMSVYVSQQTTPRGECLSGYYCYAGGFIRWALGTLSPGEVRVVRFTDQIEIAATDGELLTTDVAVNVDGATVVQDSHTVVVSEDPVDPNIQPLPPPTGVQASQGVFSDNVQISWNAVVRADNYEVLRAQIPSIDLGVPICPPGITPPCNTTAISYHDATIVLGVTYYYWIKACSNTPAVGCSIHSAMASGYATTDTPPGTFSLSNDPPFWDNRPPAGPAVQLRWTHSSKAANYEVYRNGILIYPLSSTFTERSFRNELGLIAGQTYSYTVLAYNSSGSTQSNTILVGPMPSVPMMPTISLVSPSTITQGNSYQDVTISGSNFTAASWHQFSTDNGVTWNPAQSFPTINGAASMTIGVNNTIVRTVLIRVCASYGSSLCSGSAAVTIQTNQGEIAPQIAKVIPNVIEQGNGTQDVTLTGTAFVAANRYQQSTDGGGTWTWAVSAPTVSDSNSMLVAIDNTVIGTIHVRVCASQESSLCSGSKAVQVHPSPLATPSVDSVSPDSIPIGASYQNVQILGNDFSATSWHQLSTNGGGTWDWAQTAPIINDSQLMTIAVSNEVAGTVDIRACASYGSGDCSTIVALTVLPENQPDELVIKCPQTGCFTSNTKAVVITHGWGANAFDWVYEMASDVCERVGTSLFYSDYQPNSTMRVCSSDEWDVWIVDWTILAIDTLLPPTTQMNAAYEGKKVAKYFLNAHDYEHYHLIGHSAGSQLIDSAAKILAPFATIHETFLDAYDFRAIVPPVLVDITRHISDYGKNADWVDNYVDTRPVCDEGVFEDGSVIDLFCKVVDQTDLHLTFGFNVDVTPTSDDCESLGYIDEFVCRHGRPYRFYSKSINNANTGTFKNRDPIMATENMGFPRSMETGSNMRDLEYGKNLECRMQSDGSCTGVPWTRYVWTYIPVAVLDTIVVGVTGTVDFVKGTAGKLFDSARFITNWILPGSDSLSWAQANSTSSTDEPAYMLVQVTTDSAINILRFDWAFDSAGEGVLQVFVNGDLVHQLDQRFVPQASVETEEVYIGGADGTLPPGTHDIAFRLDGYGGNPSDIMLTNVELGLKQVVDANAYEVIFTDGFEGK